MCLNPKLSYHPYHIVHSNMAKDFYVLGVKSTRQDFYDTSISDFINSARLSCGRIDSILLQQVVDSTFCVDSNGHKLPLLLILPCRRCIECSRDYRNDIVSRCLIEAAHCNHVFFYTLTYDDDHVPTEGLVKRHVSSAFKLFREHFSRYVLNGRRLDFTQVYVGEYGSDPRYSMRPHYHGIIFVRDHLSDSELESFFDFFRPRSNPRNITHIVNGRRELLEISSFYSDESHQFLQHWWPYGVLFDLQAPKKNVVALAKYVCKYITKQFFTPNDKQIEAFERIDYPTQTIYTDFDSQFRNPFTIDSSGNIKRFQLDGSTPREGHRNPCFVQLPKREGLAARYIDEYSDYILHSNSPCIQVNVHGVLQRFKVPQSYIRKLFPSLGDICPNISFYYKLFQSLVRKLTVLVDRIVKLSDEDFILNDVQSSSRISQYLRPQLEIFNDFLSKRTIYNSFALSRVRNCVLSFMESFADSLDISKLFDWCLEIFRKHIIFAPESLVVEQIISQKRLYYDSLQVPDLSYSQRESISYARNSYDLYSTNLISYSVYDSIR